MRRDGLEYEFTTAPLIEDALAPVIRTGRALFKAGAVVAAVAVFLMVTATLRGPAHEVVSPDFHLAEAR